jgi:hypothetical protein
MIEVHFNDYQPNAWPPPAQPDAPSLETIMAWLSHAIAAKRVLVLNKDGLMEPVGTGILQTKQGDLIFVGLDDEHPFIQLALGKTKPEDWKVVPHG